MTSLKMADGIVENPAQLEVITSCKQAIFYEIAGALG